MTESLEIASRSDYVRALCALDPVLSASLLEIHADLSDEELEAEERLRAVEAWEEATFPRAPMAAHEAVRLWTEIAEVPADALARAFGSEEQARAALEGRAPLSSGMVGGLVRTLGMPMSVLVWPVGWKARHVERVMAQKRAAGTAAGAAEPAQAPQELGDFKGPFVRRQ